MTRLIKIIALASAAGCRSVRPGIIGCGGEPGGCMVLLSAPRFGDIK